MAMAKGCSTYKIKVILSSASVPSVGVWVGIKVPSGHVQRLLRVFEIGHGRAIVSSPRPLGKTRHKRGEGDRLEISAWYHTIHQSHAVERLDAGTDAIEWSSYCTQSRI